MKFIIKTTKTFFAFFATLLLAGQFFSACTSSTGSPAETGATKTEKKTYKLGFIPLTDCASLVMAKELGLFEKYGVNVDVTKEASWANVRDKILTGELTGAHCLFGMPFSVYTGIGGKAGSEMKIAMIINNNGQAITLSEKFCGLIGNNEVGKVAGAVEKLNAQKQVQFAMTFPGGTHDIWLRYWLAAAGVDPKKVGIKVIPPPQMVANMKVDNMDGFCVGEPWNGVVVKEGFGFTHVTTQEIWKHHPEKALVVNDKFAAENKEDLKKIMKAIIEASIWLDSLPNRKKAAAVIAQQQYVNAPVDVVEARLMGEYNMGCKTGDRKYTDDYMLYHNNGLTNFPRKSHGMWYLAQYVRFGLLTTPPEDYKSIADRLIMQDLYKEVAAEMKIATPDDDMQPFTVTIDKRTFDPNQVPVYLASAKK
jgi:nitrate/nitrite transport system substrate-binding protein